MIPLKKVIISTIGISVLFGTTIFAANAEQVDSRAANVDINSKINIEQIDSRLEALQTAVAAKTSKYDLRDRITIPVYDQKSSENCWAFSLRVAFETTLRLSSGEGVNISTQHMAYATSDSFSGGSGYKYGLRRDALDLGTHLMGLGYLTNGSGPIDENRMPFSDKQKNISVSEVENKKSIKKTEGWKILGGVHKTNNGGKVSYSYLGTSINQSETNNIRNSIKQHIMSYGPVVSGIRYLKEDMNSNAQSVYYNGNEGISHAVTIIGWDDNYSKNNFTGSVKPEHDGAYLIQNSYGNKHTYFYVSYDDSYIEEYTYGIEKINFINYYKIYQHDGQGANMGGAITGDTYYAASVFERETTTPEFLNEVALTTFYDANYEIYVNATDGSISGPNLKKVKVSSNPLKPGYTTIKLDEKLELKGNKFAIVVKYTKVKNKLFGITLLSKTTLDGYSTGEAYSTLQSAQGQCFIGTSEATMQDTYAIGGAKTCIKAFTRKLDNKQDISDKVKINSKDQGTSNNCWTMPISTVLETNRALNNNDNSEMSALHMDYGTSQSFTNGALNQFGFNRLANTAGTAEWGLAYFTNGSGPILEMSMPFKDVFNNISLSEVTNKVTMAKVEDWVMFPKIFKEITETGVKYLTEKGTEYTQSQIQEIRDKIKLHIMDYGAIATETYIEGANKYYNKDTKSYYCDDETIKRDHGLAIIGWDDNYPKENFNEEHRPTTDGAYIVQNSYGKENEIAEKFYVSYEDPNIERNTYGIVNVTDKDIAKENIYQHDELGRNTSFTVNKDETYGANVFERDTNKEEYLKEISISTYGDMNYEVYVNPADGSISTDKMNLVAKSYNEIGNGYHTVKFAEPIKLTGEKFVVAIKYIGKDGSTMVTMQSKLTYEEGESPYQNVTSKEGESYVGLSLDSMIDMKRMDNLPEGNLCIKAFTEDPNGTYTPLQGDINLDGQITTTDLSLIKMHLVELKLLKGYQFEAADMNRDGKVSSTDLSTLMRKLVNL